MKIILTLLVLLISINIKSNNFVKLNEAIDINVCKNYPTNKSYEWSVIEKPMSSALKDNDININNCFISFTPDKIGHYQIGLKVDEFKELFSFEVLESLEKSTIDISYYTESDYYYNSLEYYKYYDNNNISFEINKKIEKFNFNIKGIALVKDLKNNKTFIINTNKNNYLKFDNLYQITFFPDNYQKKEIIINTKDLNNNIDLIPLTRKLNLEVKNHENKKIIGTTSIYYNEITLSTFLGYNVFIDNPNKILFSPIKTINNYPSIIYTDSTNIHSLKYDNIEFHKLKIHLEDIQDSQFITIKIKSLSLDKCLIDNLNAQCIYQRAFILNKNKEILLPSGKYEITVYKKGFNKIIKTIDFNNDYDFTIDNFLEKNIVKVTLPENIISISFSDKENNDYHFKIDDTIKELYIPIGIYNISLFTYNGIFNIKLLEINDDTKIEYNWRKININIKENSKIKYGGIILIEDKNYISNNGNLHEFYIKK